MVIADDNDKLVEMASRKLFELSETHPAYKQYSALLRSRGAACWQTKKIPIPPKPQKTSGTTNININGCPSQSCIGKSVVDLLMRRPKLFTFKEACAILEHCDVVRDRKFIDDIIRKYALVIIGLPHCSEDDLPLAVYFFIEDMFGFKANMELCVRIKTKHCQDNVIGIVFDNVTAKEKITGKLCILDDSGIEISTRFDINWIIDKLCEDGVHA